MSIPRPDIGIMDISFETFENLISCLNENEAWKTVASKFSEICHMFSANDIRLISLDSSPPHRLLSELHDRLCTVEILCEVLLRCNLLHALALLREPEPLTIIRQPCAEEGDTVYIQLSEDLYLECEAFGLPPPCYLWHRDNEVLEGQTSNSLLIENFGLKTAVFQDYTGYSQIFSSTPIGQHWDLLKKPDTQRDEIVGIEENIQLWSSRLENSCLQTDTTVKAPEHEGEYYCVISQDNNPDTEVHTDYVKVKVHPEPPVIHEHPPSQIVCSSGSDVLLECNASGYPEVKYQWYRDNTLLDGEITNVLRIGCVTQTDEGCYRCCIGNEAGEEYTRPCTLTVYEDICSPRCRASVKVALLIANKSYSNLSKLNTPVNDVTALAHILESFDFKVIALKDLTLVEMRNAIRLFCSMLCPGAYGFIYFVGHGFEIQEKFMLPVDAPGPEKYLRSDSLCEKEVIRDALEQNPQLLIMLLDMCLKIPDRTENPQIYEERPAVYNYKPERNLVIGCATTSSLGAYEFENQENGIYMSHLKKFLTEGDIPVGKILWKVQESISNEIPDASDKQIPILSSNIVREFYLTDDATGNEETDELYEHITDLPPKTEILFPQIEVVAMVTFHKYRDCFLNAMELHVTNVDHWTVRCLAMSTEITFDYERQDGKLVVFIHNIQKLKAPLVVTMSLHDANTDKLIDNCLLDLQLPLIAPADLWCCPPDTDLPCQSTATL